MTDTISFKCSKCGSDQFAFPNQPPQDDDIIECTGCKSQGRYADIRDTAVKLAKDEVGRMFKDAFKGWKTK